MFTSSVINSPKACPQGYISYPSAESAWKTAKSMSSSSIAKRRKNVKTLSVYKCKLCGKFHLTSSK